MKGKQYWTFSARDISSDLNRAKDAQNDSKRRYALGDGIRNRDESLMNRAGATRLYGDVTVRNFAGHSWVCLEVLRNSE